MLRPADALKKNQLFAHCNEYECSAILAASQTYRLSMGQKIDLKNERALFVVLCGFLVPELSPVKADSLYFCEGSFFGSLPFLDAQPRGALKALADTVLLRLDEDGMHRMFALSYKSFRAYLKILQNRMLPLSERAGEFVQKHARIITVYSRKAQSGKSFFAAHLACMLEKHGQVAVLDASYSGQSVFDYFEKKLYAPVSQRESGESLTEAYLEKRIERVSDSLALLNVSFGSKVRVQPEIISPLVFLLSHRYSFIIIDVSDTDAVLAERIFDLSDDVFCVEKREKDILRDERLFDGVLTCGQQLHFVINEYFEKHPLEHNGLLFPCQKTKQDSALYPQIFKQAGEDWSEKICTQLLLKKTALVLEPCGFRSLYYSGLFEQNPKFIAESDVYASSVAFIAAALYRISGGRGVYHKLLKKYFSADRIASFLDVVFPEKNIFQNEKIYRAASDVASDLRLEKISPRICCILHDDATRFISIGYVRDMLAASFSVDPAFAPYRIGDRFLHAGSAAGICPEALYRMGYDEVSSAGVDAQISIDFESKPVISLFASLLDLQASRDSSSFGISAVKRVSVEPSGAVKTVDDVLNESSALWQDACRPQSPV